MSYGQQPDPTQGNQPTTPPPVPQAPGYGASPYGAPQQGYGAAQPSPGVPGHPYGAQHGNEQPYPLGPTYGQYGAGPMAPGAPWGGAPARRPGTVTAGCVLAFIGGGFMVIMGLIIALAGGAGAFDGMDIPGFGPGDGGLLTGVGIVFLLIGALVVFFGVMAFRGKRWAAITLAVFAGLSVLGGISDLASGTGTSLIGVAWSVTGAVLLLVPASQAWYRAKAGMRA